MIKQAYSVFHLGDQLDTDQVSGIGQSGIQQVMELILWILAVVLVVAGILALFRRQILWGIVLIVVGLLVGPGGVSIFN